MYVCFNCEIKIIFYMPDINAVIAWKPQISGQNWEVIWWDLIDIYNSQKR